MYCRAEVLQPPVEIAGVVYIHKGVVQPALDVTGELINLERAGRVKIHTPLDAVSENPENYQLILYTGLNMQEITPRGVLYRGVGTWADEKTVEFFKSAFENLTTVEVPYIGSNAVDVDFCRDFLPHLPARARILIMRDMGAGDVILSVPATRRLREIMPDARITFATLPRNTELLHGVDAIDEVVSIHGVRLDADSGWDCVINWSRCLEDYRVPRNRGTRIESYARHLGFEVANCDLKLHLQTETRQRAWGLLETEADGRTLIGYVMQAVAWNRTWPLWKVPELIAAFANEMPDCQLVLIDSQAEAGEDYEPCENIINLCGKTRTFSEAAAVLENCAAVITPDTGLAHACGALGVPTLALVGSIPPEARFATYENFRWIYPEGRVECCPCWDWQEPWRPSEKRGHPERGIYRSCKHDAIPWCLDSISAGEIVEAVRGMLDDAQHCSKLSTEEIS